MKHHLFLYAGLLGTLLSVGASQSYASDVGSADILSYNNTSTVTGAATPERMALRKLFHTPQFNVIDPVDQFALDWNGFTPLGAIVTQDRRASQSDVGSADILSYNNTNTVTGAATPERMALRKLFYTPQFNVIDPVDQFALDWNGFTPLGAIVTQDRRAAQSEGPANTGAGADKHTASN